MGVVCNFNINYVQNWGFTLVFPKQEVKFAVGDTDRNGSAAHFCEFSSSSAHCADASAPFLFGVVFSFSFDCDQRFFLKKKPSVLNRR
jgi:hypothetical protein